MFNLVPRKTVDMRKKTIASRLAAAGLATTVAALGTTARPSSAAGSQGVGTGTVVTSVVDAALGNLLGLTLLEDIAQSTTDPKVGPAGASSVLSQLKLSSTLPALNRVIGQHKVAAPGGPGEISTSLLNLNELGLGAVVNGTIEPILLKALNQPSSATASSARITDLGLLGGLASLGVLNSTDRTGSGTAAAEAARAMSLDALSVLNLGALLDGLGLDILTLPLSVVSGLVSSLGIPLDLQGASSLSALITSLTGSIDALADTASSTVTAPLVNLIDGLGLPVPLQPVVDTAVSTAVSTLQSTLTSLINTVTSLLENVTLLKLNALNLNTLARATETVAGSEATATGTLGGLQVGPVALPGLDLLAVTSVVNSLLAQIESVLGAVLAPLGISDLLKVRLFDKETGVTQADGVVKAVSSITGLLVKVQPPADLLGTITRLTDPAGGLGGLLGAGRTAAKAGSVRSASAASVAAVNPLEGLLGVTSILQKGLELRVGTVKSQSLHVVPAAVPSTPQSPIPTGTGTLPRTGGEQTAFALLAMSLAALGLGARRLYRRDATDHG